jgi:hypothetical protein
MSGGHYDYKYFRVDELADDIEREFVNEGKYMDKDWSAPITGFDRKKPMIEKDRLEDVTEEQKEIILREVNSLVGDLRNCSKRAKELEWYMSGDTGATSYLERLGKIKK